MTDDDSEVRTQTQLHAARHAGREPPLDRRARLGRVLRERAEVEVAVVQHVPDHRAQLKLAPAERERRVRDGVVGEATGRVRLVAPEPLPPHVARVEGGAERRPARQGEHGQRCAGVHAVVRHQRERVAWLDCFAIGVARGGQPGGGLERRGGVAVVRVQPQAGGAEPLQRQLEPAAARRADVLEVAARHAGRDEEDVFPHVRAVQVGAGVEPPVRRTEAPPQLVGRGHDGPERGIGPERERQRAGRQGVGAPDLYDGGRAEAAARRRRHLVPAARAPGEAGARGQPAEDVEAALRGIDEVLERHADPIVACRQRRREPRDHVEVAAQERARVHLVGADRLGERVGTAAGNREDAHRRVLVVRVRARELRWLAGADADYQHTAVRILAIPGGGPDSLTESVRTNQVDAGAFLGGNLDVVPRLTATLAARYDWIRVPFEDLVDPSQSGLNIFRRLSPRAGLTWSAGRGHEMSASASRGFRAPAVVEIGCADSLAACPLPFALGPDPALRPVVATTYELGWRFRAPHGRLDASTNLYRTDVRDDIFFIASSVTGGYFQNIRATRRSGFELALQWLGPAGLRLYANYGYTTATFETTARLATTRDPNGETIEPGDALPLVPNHRVNAGAALPVFTLSSGPSLRAALDAHYVGRQWLRGDEANATGRLSDYAVADASLTLGWRELELRAMVRNVLDHRYFNFGTFAENPTEPGTPVQRWLTPGVPRSVQLSLSTDF